MTLSQDFRSGYVTIVGRPNVGKSTLLNQLLNFKLSIVTHKPQTTRRKVLGILSGEDHQIIFVDTPGMIEPRYNLQKVMMDYVQSAIEDADIVVLMEDCTDKLRHLDLTKTVVEGIKKPVILVLNKVDKINKADLLPLIDRYQTVHDFAAIVPVSALKANGLDVLVKEIVHSLPHNPPYFPPDYITDQQERFFVSEIIREKIFQLYGEEIPYSCHVQIEEFKEREEHKDYIRAVVYVEKISQKGILIGKRGEALKRVGSIARQEIESFLERPVYLELYVKVMEDWRRKERHLKTFGY